MISPVSTLHGSTTQIDSNPQLYGRRSAGSGDGSNPQNSTSLPTATLAAPSGISPGQPSVPRKAVPFKINGKELNAIPFGDGTKRTWNNYFENSHPFGGRECGGGIRDSVYGNSIYGSGYPGQTERGVEGRGFPFFFYPITFPVGNGPDYLYREGEYGNATDPSRPGGPLFQFSVYPVVTYQSTPPYKVHIVSDNATVQFLNIAIAFSCPQYSGTPTAIAINTPVPVTYNKSSDPLEYSPLPEDIIQYYRASSVALILEGYNNTNTVFNTTNTSLTLPPLTLAPNISRDFIDCINHTIGLSVPLVGGAITRDAPNGVDNGVYAGVLSVFVIWLSVCSWVL
ncbi:hypothetical protein BJ165DRAFT_1355899 [Panaeolus papilionaceus]|nr:hypothetical protein BJ165DRAFT_1355899 [Panaeolus papilionaceus]